MNFEIDICDGKYIFISDSGKYRVLRYGEEWRDVTGDKFIYSMAHELYELRQNLIEINNNVKEIKSMMDDNGSKIDLLKTIFKGE